MMVRIWGKRTETEGGERMRYRRGANPNTSLPVCTHAQTSGSGKRSAVCVWFNYDEK